MPDALITRDRILASSSRMISAAKQTRILGRLRLRGMGPGPYIVLPLFGQSDAETRWTRGRYRTYPVYM